MNNPFIVAQRNRLPFILFLFTMSFCTPKTSSTPKTHTVEIINMTFQPEVLQVNKGDTVIFVNKDMVAHDATELNKVWFSPPLNSGDSWKWVADKSADYYCSIHLVMKGKIYIN